jgi:hypothetical protein
MSTLPDRADRTPQIPLGEQVKAIDHGLWLAVEILAESLNVSPAQIVTSALEQCDLIKAYWAGSMSGYQERLYAEPSAGHG